MFCVDRKNHRRKISWLFRREMQLRMSKISDMWSLQTRLFQQITLIPAKKWTVDQKNMIHSKSKQLHFNIAWNECGLKWLWSPMTVVSNDCGLKWLWSQMTVVSNDCGLQWLWSPMAVVSNDCGLQWLWSPMTVVSNDCGLQWLWSQMTVI